MQHRMCESGANLSVENCEMCWNAVHIVLQSVVFQTVNCAAVDFSDEYNNWRKKRLTVYCKGSTYSALTECKHFNSYFAGWFYRTKNNKLLPLLQQYVTCTYDSTNVTTCCEQCCGTDSQQVLYCRWHLFCGLADLIAHIATYWLTS